MEIANTVQQLLPYAKEMRRELHKIPENSLVEYKTQAFLKEELEKLHPDRLDVFAKTGLRAVFFGSEGKKTIAFRADMDALPIMEETSHDYQSTHQGCMHACGHDGHMAALLSWGKYISARRDKLKDNIVLLFQPGEEGTGGADIMIGEGALKDPDVDCVYGLHMDPETENGKIGIKPGPLMASVTEFDIHLKGKSAHGAAPQLGSDAIIAATQLVGQLQTIVSRNVDPAKKSLITIGKIKGGDNRNIIAENVKLEGTFRTYDESVTQLIRSRIKDMLRGLESTFGVSGIYDELVHFPPVVNDEELTRELVSLLNEDEVEIKKERMIGEDFSFYQRAVPGVFYFLGVRRGKEYVHSLHSNQFDFDESSLLGGLEVYRRLLQLED